MPQADGVTTPLSPTMGYLVEDGHRRHVEGPQRTWPGVVCTCKCRLMEALGVSMMGDRLELELVPGGDGGDRSVVEEGCVGVGVEGDRMAQDEVVVEGCE